MRQDASSDTNDRAFVGHLHYWRADEDAAWDEEAAVVAFGCGEFPQGMDAVLRGAEPSAVTGANPPDAG